MGIMRKALDNGKKLAKASIKMMPKGKTGVVVKEPEEQEEEIEEEEMEVEETPVEEEVEETFEEIKETPKQEINYIVGEIVPYAKEIGYRVVNTNGELIECSDYAQAILVAQAVKNETTTE